MAASAGKKSTAKCFLRKRVPFIKKGGVPARRNNMANVVFGLNVNWYKFYWCFAHIGQCKPDHGEMFNRESKKSA